MSNDPIGVTEEASFAIAEDDDGETNLGYCTCLGSERLPYCGLPEHRAAARQARRQKLYERLDKVGKIAQDIALGADVAKAIPDDVTADMLIARALAVIPADVHKPTADPFTAGYRQALLVVADALGIDAPFRQGFTVLFDTDASAEFIAHARDELGRRVEQLWQAHG